jgi:hypothetical protein
MLPPAFSHLQQLIRLRHHNQALGRDTLYKREIDCTQHMQQARLCGTKYGMPAHFRCDTAKAVQCQQSAVEALKVHQPDQPLVRNNNLLQLHSRLLTARTHYL